MMVRCGGEAGGRRALVAALVLAGAALVAAGCGGSGKQGAGAGTAEGTTENGDRPVVLARIGTTTITSQTLNERLKELPSFQQSAYTSAEGKKQFLDNMVNEEIMYQAALDKGLANDPDVARKVRDMRRRELIEAYYTRYIQDAAQPDSADIAKYYHEHTAEFTEPDEVKVRHILVKTEAEAKKIRADIVSGKTTFETAAREFSTDAASKGQAGLVNGYVSAGLPVGPLGVLPEFTKAAFALDVGQVSEPVKTTAGWHLIKVEEKKASHLRPLAEVKDQIAAAGAGDRIRRKYQDMTGALRKKYRVQEFDAALTQAPAPMSSEQLFQEAQETTDPRARITLYERVLHDYPADKRNYEAQFMIGFVYSEDLKDYDKARDAFQKVITNYPTCDLVESAKWMMSNMHTENPSFLPDSGSGAHGASAAGADGGGTGSTAGG